MKKITISVLILVTIGMNLLFAQESNITDYTDQLLGGGTDLFGYKDGNTVEIKSMTKNSINFTSSIIKDETGEKIETYEVLFGKNTVEEILENDSLLDSLQTKKITYNGNEERLLFSLSTEEENITIEDIYYVYVLPKDVTEMPGTVSREFCFNLEYNIHGLGNECSKKIKELKSIHNAAGADMELANISHTVNGETVVLTRTPIDGSDKLEFFLLKEDDTDDDSIKREKLGEADMFDQKFVFDYEKNESTKVRINPDNGGKEVVYNLNFTPPVEKKEPNPIPEPKPIPVVPETGTKENILIIFIITILGFVLYKAMKKSH